MNNKEFKFKLNTDFFKLSRSKYTGYCLDFYGLNNVQFIHFFTNIKTNDTRLIEILISSEIFDYRTHEGLYIFELNAMGKIYFI